MGIMAPVFLLIGIFFSLDNVFANEVAVFSSPETIFFTQFLSSRRESFFLLPAVFNEKRLFSIPILLNIKGLREKNGKESTGER